MPMSLDDILSCQKAPELTGNLLFRFIYSHLNTSPSSVFFLALSRAFTFVYKALDGLCNIHSRPSAMFCHSVC